MKKVFSIVIPVYKNELNLPVTIPYILEKIPILFEDYQVEIILINDGSPDHSWEIMKRYQREYSEIISIASLTRNFGQVMAIHCGLSLARGDIIGVISADLQDPFELFADMLKQYEAGAKLVCAVRQNRNERGLSILFSKLTHKLIHQFIMCEYPEGGFDFFLMDRTVAQSYLGIKEKNGSPQILLLWLGYKVSFIPYSRKERKIGKSGWTLSKKIKLFIDIIVTNTYLPLRVMSVIGFMCACGAFLYASWIILSAFIGEREVLGWSSIATLITFFGGIVLASLGLIGEYLWRIFDAVRGRPLYLIGEEINEIKYKND